MTLSKVLVRSFFVLGILLTALFIVLWVRFSGKLNDQFKESVPYKLSVEYIINDDEIKGLVGGDLVFGKSIGGHLTPEREARLVFKVKGDKALVRATCIVEYVSNKWEISSVNYE